MACNYLHITDNLLDPSHVSWVHQSSFGSAACEDTALDTIVADNGVTVSRWMRNVEPAPFYMPFLKFKGRCDRKQQYEVRFPSHAYIKAIFVLEQEEVLRKVYTLPEGSEEPVKASRSAKAGGWIQHPCPRNISTFSSSTLEDE